MKKIDRAEIQVSSAEHTAADVEVLVKDFQARGFWVCLKESFVYKGKKVWVVEIQW